MNSFCAKSNYLSQDPLSYRPELCCGVSGLMAQPGMQADRKSRCPWATDSLAIAYHDREWGVPQHDDRVLFEFLILEGAQAGLSWSTILNKRDAYRKAFSGFDIGKVARLTDAALEKLLLDQIGRAHV